MVIYFYLAVYIVNNAERDEKKHADIILVLGARAYSGQRYNPCLVARIKHAVDLYKAKYAPKLLFSGGNDKKDGVNEAQTMKKIALSLGIPAKDILLESKSTSTYENLSFSKKRLKVEKLKSIILVTDPFHSPRAMLVARKLRLNAFMSPATKSICWTKHRYLSRYFIKEPLAIMVYKIQNKL
jgi:uncharacterized SAM-binding protein YcdF (DUF218 family)